MNPRLRQLANEFADEHFKYTNPPGHADTVLVSLYLAGAMQMNKDCAEVAKSWRKETSVYDDPLKLDVANEIAESIKALAEDSE